MVTVNKPANGLLQVGAAWCWRPLNRSKTPEYITDLQMQLWQWESQVFLITYLIQIITYLIQIRIQVIILTYRSTQVMVPPSV